MDVKNICCYKNQKKQRRTVRLRDLPYLMGHTLTDVFYATNDAVNYNDLLVCLQSIINATVVLIHVKNNNLFYGIETAENEQLILKIVLNIEKNTQ